MQFLKGHISVILALMLLSIFSTAVWADDVDCVNFKDKPDVRCKYYRIWSTRGAQLYVVDPDSAIIKKNALPDKEFLVYLPRKVSKDTVRAFLAADSSEIKNMTPVKSDKDSGLVNIRVTGNYPYYNYQLGTAMREDDPDPLVNLVYSFYAPELEYSIDGKVVTDRDILERVVGDEIEVDVRAVIPVGPQKTRTDSTLDKTFYFDSFDEDDNLQFLSMGGTSLKQSDGTIRLDLVKGMGSFKIVATKSVNGSSFALEGFEDGKDSDGNPKFIVSEKFPGSIVFAGQDMPTLSKAAIFDTDGDGVGDSIATWFGGNMDSVSVENFYYSWPKSEKFITYAGDVKQNGKVYGLPDAHAELQGDSAVGVMKAFVKSPLAERSDTLSTDLLDSIGAVIRTASLIKGNGKSDTLVVRFSKIMDSSWTEGRGLLLEGSSIEVTAVKKDGAIWKFAVAAGSVSVGDMLKIETFCNKEKCPDGILTAASGIPTAKNNQAVPVKNSGRVYMDKDDNGFFDRDGDGRMDSVFVGFDMPITEEDLKNMELTFYWLDNSGKLVAIVPDVKDLVIMDGGNRVGYSIDAAEYDVKKMLTSIDKSYSDGGKVEYGYAKLVNKVTVDGKEILEESECDINDSMPPVISGNFLNPESFQEMEPDRFRITFSEPVKLDGDVDDDWLEFYVDGAWVHYDLGDAVWSDDGRVVTFLMEAGDDLTGRMNPADSIRFGSASKIKDANGNIASAGIPATMVKGDPRVVMKTTSMADLTRAEELSSRVKPFTIDHVKSGLSEEQKASLGVLMDVGFSTIMKADSNGVLKADVKKIGLKWELYVYTNLGAFVGSASGRIDCDDPFFDGNCLENPDKLYVRWNMRADNGRKVGVGLYLAKFNIKVFGAEEDFKVERVFRWGVTATHR
ncbi:MAG: hypothetical protein MJY98_04290 [Fibrobacter sp.]|nr:hypothetical protein [Fibrobacter sp.]